jgi:H+/Cl- antiporter ClcA
VPLGACWHVALLSSPANGSLLGIFRSAASFRNAHPEYVAGWDTARRRIATGLGAISLGLVAIAFAWLGDEAQRIFTDFQAQFPYAPLVLTPLVFAAVSWITGRHAPDARGSGIPQVIAATKDLELAYGRLLSISTSLTKLLLTVALLLAGGSVGREGPTVQVSATIMVAWHKLLRVPMTAGVLIAGGAAGVAAAFNTPLAGVAFAIEELASAFEQRVALLVMGAVVIAGLVSLGIAGDYLYFGVMDASLGVRDTIVLAPLCGVVGGALGGLFSRLLFYVTRLETGWLQQVRRRPVLFALGCGLVVAVIGVWTGGATFGTGYEYTRSLVEGQGGADAWFGLTKFVTTLVTAISGVPGGIFAPSLAVGAGVGQALATFFPADPIETIVLLGMTGYFVGVVRAPLTAVIILMETTASRGMIIPLFLTALIADGTSKLVCREKLYHGLARGFLPVTPPKPLPDAR